MFAARAQQPDMGGGWHWHPQEEVWEILEGGLEITIDGNRLRPMA
jgi:mannose-6-phosphate isomerase-like protein (cupin superfamily)